VENIDYQMAACFHPSYKLNWIQFWDPEKYDGTVEFCNFLFLIINSLISTISLFL